MRGRHLGATLLLVPGSNIALAAARHNILFILADNVDAEASSLYPPAGIQGAAALDDFRTTRGCFGNPEERQ